MTGIIDIGSNTIRLIMYQDTIEISNTSVNSEIISDTQNGVLSYEGIEKLCRALENFKTIAGENDLYAFATFAFRSLRNKEQVKEEILKKTGVNIDILSGEKEAEYDFLGLKNNIQKDESAVGIDLGGGSAQIMIFEGDNIIFSKSLPIGCRKVKNKFVRGNFPNSTEKQEIRSYIENKLYNINDFDVKGKKLYIMGGTAKTALKLKNLLTDEKGNMISKKQMSDLISFTEKTPGEAVKNLLKNRYDNITVGIIIMEEMAKAFKKEVVYVKNCGVRDGYLMSKIK